MAKMTPEAREAFLASVHVGVLSVAEPDRGPLTVPIWYAYEPGGDVWLWTDTTSRKAALLRQAGRASFCVQHETQPYQYVSVEGPVTIVPATTDEIRHLVARYVGVDATDAYLAALTGGGATETDCIVRIRPERWLTFDEGAAA